MDFFHIMLLRILPACIFKDLNVQDILLFNEKYAAHQNKEA
jgi:hypothetical protein